MGIKTEDGALRRWTAIYFAIIVILGPIVGVAFFLAVWTLRSQIGCLWDSFLLS
jgi:hypothetical protein